MHSVRRCERPQMLYVLGDSQVWMSGPMLASASLKIAGTPGLPPESALAAMGAAAAAMRGRFCSGEPLPAIACCVAAWLGAGARCALAACCCMPRCLLPGACAVSHLIETMK